MPTIQVLGGEKGKKKINDECLPSINCAYNQCQILLSQINKQLSKKVGHDKAKNHWQMLEPKIVNICRVT